MPPGDPFPASPGTYILVLECQAPALVTAGALGQLLTEPGWYLYVGSAFGPGGLNGRLRHHLSPSRPQHWHVDALKPVARLRQVWYSVEPRRLEHAWALTCQALPGLRIPWKGFGSSGCACPAHLFHSPLPPAAGLFEQALDGLHPAHAPFQIAQIEL